MKKGNKKMLRPAEAMKRIKSAATIVAVGPSSSGKSTLIYALVNHRVVVFISRGIGDKSQTTIIPCTFLFDERIEPRHFALAIKTRRFTAKDISTEFRDQLAILFASNSACADDTLDSIDSLWMNRVLEPDSASYHLGCLKTEITADKLKDAVQSILKAIEEMEDSFEQRVNRKKAELKKNPLKEKAKITDIRRMIFNEMWEEVEPELTQEYTSLLNEIGESVKRKLYALVGEDMDEGSVYEYSTDESDEYPYGGVVLEELFDPDKPYSLIVDEMTLTCCPREEILSDDDEIPVRFCLRDTMGLTQLDTEDSTIKNALDIALNCSPDSILLLINLEERDDVISKSIDAISAKFKRAKEMDVPLNVFYTKADKIIDNLIYKKNRKTVDIKQQDYNDHIEEAIEDVECTVASYNEKLSANSAVWLSLRYKDAGIDPIQKALQLNKSSEVERFTSNGLYKNIEKILEDAQSRILPKGMAAPLVVQVNDYDLPAVFFEIDENVMTDTMEQIRLKLTEDKAIYNRYLITDSTRIHGRSVVKYFEKLQSGEGYKTNANVYGNFNINMKLMLYRVLCEHVPKFSTLYEKQAVSTNAENLPVEEVNKMVERFDENQAITETAYVDINPEIWKGIPENVKMSQKLHLIFRNYFVTSEKYYMVMNRVALQLSYRNPYIKKAIDDIYYDYSLTYDETIRGMQFQFKKIFSTDRFSRIIAHEISEAMTDLVNKMFVTI